MRILHGDCVGVMGGLGSSSVDSIVTDPPYGLVFMGKRWDSGVPGVETWAECLRVLKPGGYLLAFGGTRTYHRLVVGIEDAGFEIRDMIGWVYGSGFPKSLDVSKAIDAAAGAKREVVGTKLGLPGYSLAPDKGRGTYSPDGRSSEVECAITAPATDAAREWAGWGTALKPAIEPIVVARKPLVGTVAENVLRHGTGAINVDACRVGTENTRAPAYRMTSKGRAGGGFGNGMDYTRDGSMAGSECGRWPANLIHDGSDEVLALFPEAGGGVATRGASSHIYGGGKGFTEATGEVIGYGDFGSAARFFYCAKASKDDRDEGCYLPALPLFEIEAQGLPLKRTAKLAGANSDRLDLDPVSERFRTSPSRNNHPTVKPTDLMRYLCKLVTPPGGVVLDPFMGSGSTGKAAVLEGFQFIGIEREAEYVEIARARIQHAANQPRQMGLSALAGSI